MSTNGLLGRDVIYEGPSHSEAALFFRAAAGTSTALLNGSEVVCELSVAQFHGAGGHNSIAETLDPISV